MSVDSTIDSPRPALRVWPGVVAVTLLWLLWFVVPRVIPAIGMAGMFGALGCAVAVLVWWLFFSRAPWVERIGVLAFMVVAVIATKRVVDLSMSNGMMGMLVPVFSVPVLSLALVAAVAIGRRFSAGQRRLTTAAAILVACGLFALLRTGGVSGTGEPDFHWRWTPTPEDRLLAQAAPLPMAPPAAPAPSASDPAPAATITTPPSVPPQPRETTMTLGPLTRGAAVWPGFRGPYRDGAVAGTRIATDWSKTPPVEVWRRPIGPGWSSFAVLGDLIYTQEQRGDDELVSCYRLSTGQPVWVHRDPVRFYESNAGPGPRGTPTIANDRIYAFGATGLLNALDANTGAAIWSRNAAAELKKATPGWGFSSSPLVVGDLVIVAVSGQLAAYDAATGAPRWRGPSRGSSYSSPHLATIDGTSQIVLLSGGGAAAVSPADGKLLWEHRWEEGASIVQPAIVDGDVLISGADMMGSIGIRRLSLTRNADGWKAGERWTTRGLKPYFNDFVVHGGHAYGFDGTILAAIDLTDGARKWKGGRYGSGQMILLGDQDLLLVLSEDGDLALVSARPNEFKELARQAAIEGKTWNHPVLIGDVVVVRNGEEMAAFRLPTVAR